MNVVLWCLGYRRLFVCAKDAVAVLNLCMAKEISYCEFSSDEAGGISFSCPLRQSAWLCKEAAAQGLSVTVLHSGGFPIALWRRRKRWGLMVGGLCALCLILLSQTVVWDVRVRGNQAMTAAEVRAELAACGFGIGSRIADLHAGELENRVLLASDRLAWISVYMDGTVAQVQVIERALRPQEESKKPANVVAACDGQIEQICLYRGEAVVKIGQPVRAGELLISGISDSEVQGYRYTRAAGVILARTERSFRVEIPLQDVQKSYSGVEKKAIWLNFFQNSVKIFKNTGNEGGACDIIEVVNSFSGLGAHSLPVSLTVQTYRYYQNTEIQRTPQEALELAYARLAGELKSLSSDTQMLRKELRTTITDTALVLDCTVLCIENIAVQSEFEVLN